MALFVARLPFEWTSGDLSKLVTPFGEVTRCDVPPRKGYGFVNFQNREDAERCIRDLDGTTQDFGRIAVEWSKGGERGGPSGRGCFRCGREGHFARECPEINGGSSSSGRYDDRYGGDRDSSSRRYDDDRYSSRDRSYDDRDRERHSSRDRYDDRSSSRRDERDDRDDRDRRSSRDRCDDRDRESSSRRYDDRDRRDDRRYDDRDRTRDRCVTLYGGKVIVADVKEHFDADRIYLADNTMLTALPDGFSERVF
eukprot:m51a1_g1970 putative rna-binding region rnp-1 domain-containing protein (253) ;mRNA; f:1087506-1089295